jgi:hypothetical protein
MISRRQWYARLLEGRQRPSVALGIREDATETRYGRVPACAELWAAWLLRGLVKLDEAAMIKCHLVFLEDLDDPGTASMKAADEVAAIVGRNSLSMAAHTGPWLRRLVSSAAMLRPRAEAAAAALAALRYWNDTGKWPETLDALVPAYIEKVPTETSAVQPLVYTVLPDGIMVYSRGGNGIDDGGKPHLVKPVPNDAGLYDDVGFRIQKSVAQEARK